MSFTFAARPPRGRLALACAAAFAWPAAHAATLDVASADPLPAGAGAPADHAVPVAAVTPASPGGNPSIPIRRPSSNRSRASGSTRTPTSPPRTR